MKTNMRASGAPLVALLLSFLTPAMALADTPREIAKRISPSVVLLVMEDASGQPLGMGSGFVVRDGIVATNMHVIEGAARGYAKLVEDKTKHDIRGIVASDAARDLVLLSVDGLKAKALGVGDSNAVAVGDAVYAVGNPRGLEGTFSAGIVSSVRKVGDDSLLQITAPISPGSSGGPVVNSKGEVIGVAVATFKGGQNLNFAIPSQYLTALIPTIKAPVDLPKAAEARRAKKQKSILDDMGGRSTDGVVGVGFIWDWPGGYGGSPDGGYSFSIRNKLREHVRDVICLVVFRDAQNEPVETDLIKVPLVPASLAKRVESRVPDSVQEVTTKDGSKTPRTKVEFRILYFDIVTPDEPADERSDASLQDAAPRIVPTADDRPVDQKEQGARALTDLMTKEEFRACGLHKLTNDELVRLNAWLLKAVVALAGAATNAGDDVPLYDKTGAAIAYLDPADEMTIYMWAGKPVAYVSGKSVYGFNGKHIGWFVDGFIYDSKGKIVAATGKTLAVKPKPAPARGLKQIKPIKAIERLAPLEPLHGITWSDTATDVFLLQGAK